MNNVFAFVRCSRDGTRQLVCVANLSPVPREGYRVGLPHGGDWVELLNTDSVLLRRQRCREPRRRSTARGAAVARAAVLASRSRCRRWRSSGCGPHGLIVTLAVSVWPGQAVPARPGMGRRRARTSRSSPRTPSASSCACSTSTGARSASSCTSARRSTGIATSPASARASTTATASTARTTRDRQALQPREAADRSVREGDRRRRSTGTRRTRCRTCRRRRGRRPDDRRLRLCARDPEVAS